jgi:glycosyltransferase involved in cell wall biosynthesis
MVEISIILPVYNVESYIEECVLSILDQTFSRYELIVIDDASTDSSMSILSSILRQRGCKDWKMISHQKNMGLSAARNTGLKEAVGEYVYFVDSDDYLDPDALSKAYTKIRETNADIVMFGLRTVFEQASKKGADEMPPVESVLTGQEALLLLLHGRCATYMCTQLFKRELFRDIRFSEGYVYEDKIILPYLFAEAVRVSFTRNIGYNYRQRAGSITKTFQPLMIMNLDKLEAVAQELSLPRKGRIWRNAFLHFKYQNIYSVLLTVMLRGKNYSEIKPIWKECRKHIRVGELIACMHLMGKPTLALSIFYVSPRLFGISFKGYFIQKHEI